jgi:hypothetical protein
MDITLTVRCVAGPDTGWVTRLRPGTHWLGRIHGDLQMLDPAVEAHHAVVELSEDGRARLVQVAGRAPIRVDGESAHGWVVRGAASVIEVGASRLELVDPASVPIGSSARVHAPLDDSDDELRRFERDVARAATAATTERGSRRPPGTVTLGVAEQQLAIDLLDARSETVDLVSLPHPAAAVLDRHGRAELPVVTTVAPDRPLAIVGSQAESVARRISLQLPPRLRARLLTVAAGEADRFRAAGRPMIVLAPDLDDVPPWCVGVLDVGATWHGTWQPDVIDRPEDVVRLHAAGASPHRPTRVHAALNPDIGAGRDVDGRRGGSGTDVGRTLVAEQVAGARPEVGSDITRVPQSAR